MFKFALRNVLRNKKRSFLSGLAVFFGAMIAAIAMGWANGMIDLMLDNWVDYQTAHVRVTTERYEQYEKFFPVEELIYDTDSLKAEIEQIEGVESVEERIRFGIMLGNDNKTSQAIGMGIDTLNSHFNMEEALIEGEIEESGIYIGSGLMEKLGVEEGQELLIATKTSEGGLNGIKLPVKGVFQFNLAMMDEQFFIIGLEDAKKLLKTYGDSTELYVFAEDINMTGDIKEEISSLLPENLVAKDYKEQIGPMYQMLAIMDVYYLFFVGIILFLASFVVINTMMMAIFERMHEIGTLKAIGMKDRELFLNFTIEGGIIGATGGILGTLIGYIMILLMSNYGIDISSAAAGMQDMPIGYIIYPTVEISSLLMVTLMAIIVPMAASMLPARKAKSLTASEALRK